MVYEWNDKIVLITGAANGIGALVVRNLVERENVKHVAVLDIDEAEGNALKAELNSKFGDKITFVKCDVTNDDQLFAGYQALIDRFGYLDVVINNAGLLNDSYKVYKKMIEVNVTALCTSTLKGLELMRKDKGGRGGTIINIASIAAFLRLSMAPMYFATKSAVLQFTRCLGMDDYYSRTGVRLYTICFGVTDTPLMTMKKMGNFDEEIEKSLEGVVKGFYMQRPSSATQGVIDSFKQAENGSTWLAHKDQPVLDISERVQRAEDILCEDFY